MSQTDRAPAAPLDRLDEAKTIDDVVRNLEQIIDWSIRQRSTIGYFATLYKRATVAVRDALAERSSKTATGWSTSTSSSPTATSTR